MMERLRIKLNQDPRLARVLKGGLSGLIGKAMTLLVSALTLPLTVRYLGPQQYGIWVTISTTVVMLAVMDLGIANTLTNLISKAFVDDNRIAARRYYATAFWISGSISLLLGLAGAALWPFIDWGRLFHVTDAGLIHEISLCATIAFLFFLLSLPLNLINRVLSGYQQTQITNYFNMVSSVLGLVAILCVIRFHGSLPMLMLIYSGSLLMGTLILNVWVNFWGRPWISPLPHHVSRSAVSALMSTGMGFFILQIAGLIVFNSDNVIITHYMGAAEVTPYSVTWKLAGYAVVLQSAIFPSLWPAYAESYRRGDFAWVRKTFWRAVRVVMGTTTVVILALVVAGRPLIRWYIGPAAVPSAVLLDAICAWTMLSAAMDLEACLLAAINRVRLQGILSVIAAVLNVALSVYFVKRIGSLGVILGTGLSYILVLVGPQTFIVWQALYRPSQARIADQQHA